MHKLVSFVVVFYKFILDYTKENIKRYSGSQRNHAFSLYVCFMNGLHFADVTGK